MTPDVVHPIPTQPPLSPSPPQANRELLSRMPDVSSRLRQAVTRSAPASEQAARHHDAAAPDSACASQAKEVQVNAQFHVLHLVAVMAKLRPEWVTTQVFKLLHARWLSPERAAR